MTNNFKYYTFAFLAIFLFSACEKKEYQTIEELDDQNIRQYIQSNNLNVQQFEETGIYYAVLEEGTGPELSYEDKVPLVFSLKTIDGAYASVDTFSSANRYYDYLGYFPYGSASANIPGAPLDQETGMKVLLKKALKNSNGKIRIIVPSRLAFGRNGTRDIPPNASVDYTIHAIDAENIAGYEDASIQQYMLRSGLQASEFTKTESGIYYKILSLGEGDFLSSDSRFKAAYDLKFLSGTSFQKADSATFSLEGVIPAWREIIPKVKEKGKVRMIIPSSESYGFEGSRDPSTGAYAIAPFTALDYDVDVQEVL